MCEYSDLFDGISISQLLPSTQNQKQKDKIVEKLLDKQKVSFINQKEKTTTESPSVNLALKFKMEKQEMDLRRKAMIKQASQFPKIIVEKNDEKQTKST